MIYLQLVDLLKVTPTIFMKLAKSQESAQFLVRMFVFRVAHIF